MHKTAFQYRIYPTKKQIRLLNCSLNECRWLYNHFLEERKYLWEEHATSLGLYDQIKALPILKVNRPSLASVYSQVLQDVAVRIDLAFKAFFRRVKSGEEAGYPRFKGEGWYDSFTYPQIGYAVNGQSVMLSKIGIVKAIIHRPIEGKIKTCCIRRASTGKWYAIFSCEVEDKLLSEIKEAVGIDVGLEKFAMFSNNDKINNPHFFRADEKDLVKAQHKMDTCEKNNRNKYKQIVGHIHERITNRRMDFAHQESRKIVNQFGIIAIEDLSINKMVHNHCLAKSISDVAWGQFINYLSYKAENAGRKLVKVNPAYTSQDCSRCGHRQTLILSDRIFSCPCCGLHIDRDLNSSLNILRLGLQSLGIQPVEAVCFS